MEHLSVAFLVYFPQTTKRMFQCFFFIIIVVFTVSLFSNKMLNEHGQQNKKNSAKEFE